MDLKPVCWDGNKESTIDSVKTIIQHLVNQYPNLISFGELIKVDLNKRPEQNLIAWQQSIDDELREIQGVGVAVINLDGETINSNYNQPLFTYVGGTNTGIYNGKLIVVNEGVLLSDNPTEALLNSRKIKIGMHELLEDLLLMNGYEDAHSRISHPITFNESIECVNNQDMKIFFNDLTKEEKTIQLYDHASNHYCKTRNDGLKSCEDYFKKFIQY